MALLPVAGFCAFGFLASYELSQPSERLPWQLGYGSGGVACLVVATMLLVLRRPDTASSRPGLPDDCE